MKKFYILLVAIMVTSLSFGQGPVITMISDGDCVGGNPKVLEIYANGTVDFSLYSLENQTNANTTWGNTFDLASLGSITDGFVYVFFDSEGGLFAAEFASATTTLDASSSSVLSVNGDDRVRIIETTSGAVIDQYGVEGTDGTGTDWEYKDGFGKRNAGTAANGGAFNPVNWTNGNGLLNGFGTCQGGATFESIIGLATYTPPTTVVPTIGIVSPTDGATLTSGDFTLNYAITNFNVATVGNGDGHFNYAIDGVDQGAQYDNTGSLSITGLSDGNHTIMLDLRNDDDTVLNPEISASITITVAPISYTQVATIADLRASAIDGFYELTGEAFINMAIDYRNQKWIQDATAGVLIYDIDGNITAGVRGDGVSGVKGQLVDYNGLLEFKPTEDATITSPSTLTITPQVITIAEILANGDNYEAELVKIESATLTDIDGGDGTFQNGQNYLMNQGADVLTFRTNFYDVDYITTALPSVAKDIVGLIGQYNDFQFTARDLADFSDVAAIAENNIKGFNMYPNPVNDVLNITTLQNSVKNVQIFNVLGKQVLAKTISETSINVSNLNAGIYIVKVEEAGNTVTRKLVIK